MKRELNKEEIKFLNFIDNIKLDIEKQNKEMKITKLLNFKGCYKDKKALILKFELLKGCYATSLLREFMKTDDIRNY